MRIRLTFLMSLIVIAPAFAVDPARVESKTGVGYWPQWRGPSGQGYVRDDKVPTEWSAAKNLLWKAKLPGAGHSTPIIWGNRVFLTCSNATGTERMLVCIKTDGTIAWSKTVWKGQPERTHNTSSHATASCVTDGKHVYAFYGTPGLFCYDFEGNKVWHHSFGIFTSEAGWGVGASPILVGDLVIQNCDNDGAAALPRGSTGQAAPASLVALNKDTGAFVWQTPRNQGRGFSTPVMIGQELVLNGPLGVWSYDPKSGKENWHCNRHPDEDNNKFGEPMPLFADGLVFAAAGRESGYLQAVKIGGTGDVTSSHVAWETRRKGIRDVGSGILAGNYLIFADSRGATLSAHDIKTGKQYFFERTKGVVAGRGSKGFYSSPIMIGKYVLCLRMDGTTFVIEPGDSLRIVRENVLKDGTDFSASPAVADGKLYLRSQTHLYCIGAKN